MTDVEAAAPDADRRSDRDGGFRGKAAKLKPPKAILVTIGLTLLTAWLFPALSHQWQDRQKARELTAGLVSEIGESTAKAIVTSNFITFGRLRSTSDETRRGFNRDAFNTLDLDWRTQSAEIEAKLQAYYSPAVVAEWRSYATLVRGTYFLITDNVSLRSDTLAQLKAHFADQFGPPLIERMRKPWIATHEASAKAAYLAVSTALLEEKASLIDRILNDHPEGFSTRPSDVMRDIVPGL